MKRSDQTEIYKKKLLNLCNDYAGYKKLFPFFKYLDNQKTIDEIQHVACFLLKHTPEVIVLCGIGGSSAGARAVIEYMRGLFIQSYQPIIFFADNIDTF